MTTGPIQILVAEDDEVSAQAVRIMLERLGCSMEIVEDGAQAVERFRQRRYDLILMGWQMPIMDGFEATARIRALPHGQATPIIGTTPSRDRAECMAAGMNDLMPKPFQIEKLRLILTRWTSFSDRCAAGDCSGRPARLQ
jgi:CheY-like chemotaxis protein